MVGLGGLEPPTSRLSSARSNQLSYKPELDKPLTPNSTEITPQTEGLLRSDRDAEMTRGASKKNGRKRDEDGGVPP